MTVNVGTFDRIARIVVGVALLAFALGYIAPGTSWSWVGWWWSPNRTSPVIGGHAGIYS